MKTVIIIVLLLVINATTASAQITEKQLKTFTGNQEIIKSSGPGLTQASGDIFLELWEQDDPDVETVMLLQNSKGKLSKIAENSSLLMGRGILGASGGNYPSLSANSLSLDYTLGSNSGQSDVSIVFEKNNDGNYYFKEYTSKSRNYGVENLFARQLITAQQTGKINFQDASENMIFEVAKLNAPSDNYDDAVDKVFSKFAKFIPEGWGLAAFAEGDLNLDQNKKDVLLILFNEANCSIRLLMQQQNGSYQLAVANNQLLTPDENFNISNLKSVIKNGYFTIEQRIAVNDDDFDHLYITFKYDDAQKKWILHRYDVEHFSGFNPKPLPNVTHLTIKDFGIIIFQNMRDLPGKNF